MLGYLHPNTVLTDTVAPGANVSESGDAAPQISGHGTGESGFSVAGQQALEWYSLLSLALTTPSPVFSPFQSP